MRATIPHLSKQLSIAADYYLKSIEILGPLAHSNPKELMFSERLAAAHYNLGTLRSQQKDLSGAERSLAECVQLLEKVPKLEDHRAAAKIYRLALGLLARVYEQLNDDEKAARVRERLERFNETM